MKPINAREKLLAAAETLMLSKGYPATPVDEICDRAGVSKGSFYHFFKTKEDLALALLESFFNTRVGPLAIGPHATEKDPVKRAFLFLDQAETLGAELWAEGCLLGSFATDLSATSPRIRVCVSAMFNKFAQALAIAFDGVANPDLDDPPTPIEIAEQFLAVVEGSIVLAKAHDDWSKFSAGLKGFRRYLRLLAG